MCHVLAQLTSMEHVVVSLVIVQQRNCWHTCCRTVPLMLACAYRTMFACILADESPIQPSTTASTVVDITTTVRPSQFDREAVVEFARNSPSGTAATSADDFAWLAKFHICTVPVAGTVQHNFSLTSPY
jgi:hypothetical protein